MNLDDKLRIALHHPMQHDKDDNGDDLYFKEDREIWEDEVIAQIKQAVSDAGYAPHTLSHLGVEYMTGQEWYKRFMAELPMGFEANTEVTDEPVIEVRLAARTARRAAGLSDTQNHAYSPASGSDGCNDTLETQ